MESTTKQRGKETMSTELPIGSRELQIKSRDIITQLGEIKTPSMAKTIPSRDTEISLREPPTQPLAESTKF
jgi:hypothetical protein